MARAEVAAGYCGKKRMKKPEVSDESGIGCRSGAQHAAPLQRIQSGSRSRRDV